MKIETKVFSNARRFSLLVIPSEAPLAVKDVTEVLGNTFFKDAGFSASYSTPLYEGLLEFDDKREAAEVVKVDFYCVDDAWKRSLKEIRNYLDLTAQVLLAGLKLSKVELHYVVGIDKPESYHNQVALQELFPSGNGVIVYSEVVDEEDVTESKVE